MIDYEDACVGCGLPCTTRCDYFNKVYPVLICDKCNKEVNDLYELNFEQLCEDCLLDALPEITSDEDEECDGCGDWCMTRYEYDDKKMCAECVKECTHVVDFDEEWM